MPQYLGRLIRRGIQFGLFGIILILNFAPAAFSQLNQNCVVSVLNRTVQVNADGTWVLPNIPANLGPVRARATCVINGETQFGQSDSFTIRTNGSTNVAPIVLGPTTPIPTSISITAPTTTLTQAGATTQLQVMATYASGLSQDRTAASTGTQYNTSNPAIVTVGLNGLVTAVSSGTAVIQAVNEGAQGLFTLQVVLAGASHGGIPDSWAMAHGLDPNDPAMPFEDPDHDGLTNLQEFQNGTDPHNPDTDGDGLTDGQEVLTYHTSPLFADSDGDGIPDGVEVTTGTNPLDSTSVNLTRALQYIEVTPSAFVLTVNTVLGQASQQLKVTGHLIDGKTTVDLTSTAKGTNYTSSDLTLCNFGVADGRVFAGRDGICTITITNSGFSASATGTVRTFAPIPLSFVRIPGFANKVDVSGNFAYVAAGVAGLQVVDVTDRRAPRLVASLDTPGNANDVQVVENRAYIADGPAGLQIIDITDPTHPRLLGTFATPGNASDVAVAGNRAFIADGSSGLQIIDVSNPTAPQGLGSVTTSGPAKGVAVAGNLAVVANGFAGIQVIDVVDPTHPTILGSQSMGGDARDVVVSGNFAFVADFSRSFTSVDISNPRNPVVRASTPSSTGGLLQDVALMGQFAFGADVFFVNGVPIINVSDPTNPVPVAILDFSNFRDDNGTGVAVDTTFVYLTAEQGLGTENGTVDDTRLYIGQYLAMEDTAGIPPTVRITSPAPGDAPIEGQTITLRADATDDIAVASVSFLINGQVVFTGTAAPYEFPFTVPVGTTSLTLGAQAIDVGGNVSLAPVVAVSVRPNSPPIITLTSPAAGATVIEGETITISADATDDVQVVSVLFSVNGVNVPLGTTLPFSTPFTVPVGMQSLTIAATATDNLSTTATATRTVNVIPDPGTTVVGLIVDPKGNPVVGATVTCLEVSGLTQSDGTFSIPGVPTVRGNVQCTVTFVASGGQILTGSATEVPTVRGGITDAAQIQLRAAAEVGMVVDNVTKSVIVFDTATDTVVGAVPIGSGANGDCSITADGTRGFATDFTNRIWVIDLITSPPRLASGQNPIPIANPGGDTSISPDGKFLLVCASKAPVSVVDIATQTEIHTLSLNSDCNSVEVLDDGSVLTTSSTTGRVRLLALDSTGNLTDTGKTLAYESPMNAYGAPGAASGFVVLYSSNSIQSFTIPGLKPVDTRQLSGSGGISGLVHPAGDRIYVRSVRGISGVVDVFAYNPVTGALSATPLFSIPVSGALPYFGMDQMAVTPDGNKLYVPQFGALVVYDAHTGHLLTSITHPAIAQPTGVCFAPSGSY